jgi:hypothetical protein
VVLTVFVFEISSVDSKEQATQIRMQSLWWEAELQKGENILCIHRVLISFLTFILLLSRSMQHQPILQISAKVLVFFSSLVLSLSLPLPASKVAFPLQL